MASVACFPKQAVSELRAAQAKRAHRAEQAAPVPGSDQAAGAAHCCAWRCWLHSAHHLWFQVFCHGMRAPVIAICRLRTLRMYVAYVPAMRALLPVCVPQVSPPRSVHRTDVDYATYTPATVDRPLSHPLTVALLAAGSVEGVASEVRAVSGEVASLHSSLTRLEAGLRREMEEVRWLCFVISFIPFLWQFAAQPFLVAVCCSAFSCAN